LRLGETAKSIQQKKVQIVVTALDAATLTIILIIEKHDVQIIS